MVSPSPALTSSPPPLPDPARLAERYVGHRCEGLRRRYGRGLVVLRVRPREWTLEAVPAAELNATWLVAMGLPEAVAARVVADVTAQDPAQGVPLVVTLEKGRGRSWAYWARYGGDGR